MVSQKLESVLNLGLSMSEEQRGLSGEINSAFQAQTGTWELIVKYNGDLLQYERSGIVIEPLIAGYAIVTIQEDLIQEFVGIPEVEYVEMPRRLFYSVSQAKEASCFAGKVVRQNLTGAGVLLAVIDSGIDYTLPCFRKEDGTTRIRYIWDQSLVPQQGEKTPQGFAMGVEYDREEIDEALMSGVRLRTRDVSEHGTAVASIAAGNDPGIQLVGAAPASELLVVKLGNSGQGSFPRTTELMRALTYVTNKAMMLSMPLAFNVSFGNTYGSHDGTSILERFLDNIAETGRMAVCVGSGNEGAAAGHTSGAIRTNETKNVELAVGSFQSSFSVQLWKNYVDTMELVLIAPGGERRQIVLENPGKVILDFAGQQVLCYVGEPNPYSVNQEIYFEWLDEPGEYVTPGVWRFLITGVEIVSGRFLMYLPSEQILSRETRFYSPVPQTTLTIPSTAAKVITVGAYNSNFDAYADFSGRGYPDEGTLNGSRTEKAFIESGQLVKPDLVAPGVDILAARVLDGVEYVSGTSFATPIVTGAAAILMEWGIVKGNDPYLYGEKLKAYLRKGAKPLRGVSYYPNARVGYGKLCLSESF